MITLLIILWCLLGLWRAYKYISWDIHDEGCLLLCHITKGLIFIFGGFISFIEYFIRDVILIGYQIVDDSDKWISINSNDIFNVTADNSWWTWEQYRYLRDTCNLIPITIIKWGIINDIFNIYSNINKNEPLISYYMTQEEYLLRTGINKPIYNIDISKHLLFNENKEIQNEINLEKK
jgi:hypothetical protein